MNAIKFPWTNYKGGNIVPLFDFKINKHKNIKKNTGPL